MVQRVKNWLKSRTAKASLLLSSAAVALAGSASAAEPSEQMTAVKTAFSTGFQDIADNMLSMIGTIVPIALGVAGVILLARRAIGWFKSLAK